MDRITRRHVRDAVVALLLAVLIGYVYFSGSGEPAKSTPPSPVAALPAAPGTTAGDAQGGADPVMPVTGTPATRSTGTRPTPTAAPLPSGAGVSVVAVAKAAVAVHASPGGKKTRTIAAKTIFGNRQVFVVAGTSGNWLRVRLPVRPNGSTGWIARSAVTLTSTPYRILVSRGHHKLTVLRAGRAVRSYPVAVGKRSTPTPRGTFYVTARVLTYDPGGAYGPAALGLSGHSDVYKTFGSGDGVIGIHGTDEKDSIGHSVSHGCVRLHNNDALALYKLIPVGTPVTIA